LTTYHTGYWGFRSDKETAWKEIDEGEVFLFHASGSKFLDVPQKEVRDVGKGVVGLGRVGAKSSKEEPAWWEELHSNGYYPYLIHFSEIYWFGDTASIRDAPVCDKTVEEMVADVHALNENIISFGEMKERTGYQIPAQGSPGNVKYPEKLFPLLVERIRGTDPENHDLSTVEREDSWSESASVRERSRDRDLDAESASTQEVSYEASVGETMEGWIDHEHALDTFEDVLLEAHFEGGETDSSDILAWHGDDVVIVEAKSIHGNNERTQIRKALGQIHEYSYFDVEQDSDLAEKSLTRCLLLTREPSHEYLDFLSDLQSEGIFTFWTDEFEIQGLPESMARLEALTA
jgi:hypothetical protein